MSDPKDLSPPQATDITMLHPLRPGLGPPHGLKIYNHQPPTLSRLPLMPGPRVTGVVSPLPPIIIIHILITYLSCTDLILQSCIHNSTGFLLFLGLWDLKSAAILRCILGNVIQSNAARCVRAKQG